jgi:hypothetical protein
MSNIFCGIGKMPKGQKRGNMRECAEKGQIRYYGIKKIDPKTLELAKSKDVLPETREKLILKMVSLRGTIKRNKGRCEESKDGNAKDEYCKIWKKAEDDLEKVLKRLKKIEGEREQMKQKESKKSKSKSKSKSKTKSKKNKTVKSKSKSKSKSKTKSKSKGKKKTVKKTKSKKK